MYEVRVRVGVLCAGVNMLSRAERWMRELIGHLMKQHRREVISEQSSVREDTSTWPTPHFVRNHSFTICSNICTVRNRNSPQTRMRMSAGVNYKSRFYLQH